MVRDTDDTDQGRLVIFLRIPVFILGAAVVFATVGSAVRTVILPRGIPAKLGRFVFISVRMLFRVRIGRRATYERLDRIMAGYAPVSLLALLVTWVSLVMAGYTAMFWGLGGRSLRAAFYLSGSSVFTLGFRQPSDLPATLLVFTEAGLGLVLLAMLITYLPSIYTAFSRREAAVAALEVRAGSPPSGVEMLERFFVMERIEALTDEVWTRWEAWFVDLEETHTSFPAVVFFRSPQPDHSWVTAAGAVLDAASLMASTVEGDRPVQAELCIRAGYLALRRVADFFRIPYNPKPKQGDPVAVTRHEYDQAYARLAQAGLPLKADVDQAWVDFAGWRVNYDTVLIALAGLTAAPPAPWSSDRGIRDYRPTLFTRRSHLVG
jgi:hypothetical protein